MLLSFMVLLGTFRLAKSVSFQEAGKPESEWNRCTSFHHSSACHRWTMEEAGGTEEPGLGVLGYGLDELKRQHRFLVNVLFQEMNAYLHSSGLEVLPGTRLWQIVVVLAA